jgi:hypothetical protein
MKRNLFVSMVLSSLFYISLLSTMFVVPLVLAARSDVSFEQAVARDSWDRTTDSPACDGARRDLSLPLADAPGPVPGEKQIPGANPGPDAAMIKQGKSRAKTIKA